MLVNYSKRDGNAVYNLEFNDGRKTNTCNEILKWLLISDLIQIETAHCDRLYSEPQPGAQTLTINFLKCYLHLDFCAQHSFLKFAHNFFVCMSKGGCYANKI